MFRLLAAIALLVVTLFAGASRIGPAPALGAFLDPAHGVWSLARSTTLPRDARASVVNLGATVTVLYDDRAVPHIFAANEDDAYRALGYVTARDRLYQLHLQTMAASGRLTEIAGARALALDREMRGLGLPRSAERLAAAARDTSAAVRRLRAYADGINSYVRALPASELPMEFRLTGTRPSEWTLADSYHLFNRMGWTLAYLALEDDRAAAASRVGTRAAAARFPDDDAIQEPIQPNGQRAPRFDARVLPPPGEPDTASGRLLAAGATFFPARTATRSEDDERRSMASNNWAVSPRRSATGHALLAGDPHLDLTLPSIWYEAHLVVPDTLDVYGVTIPGAPGIIIGFTQAVSWTFTNTGADVMDYYVETVDQSNAPTRYQVDGEWRSLTLRAESYRDASGHELRVDTLRFTHRGPMRKIGTKWISVRWTVLESMHFLEGFDAASRAKTSAELLDSMSDLYESPAQNMLTADTSGVIGIRSTGRYPMRPSTGRGDLLRDGSLSASDWTGSWPIKDYPQSLRPAQGFLVSANQEPFDPKVQPRYFGSNWERPWRAININTLLRKDSAVTPDAMRRYQTDPASARADLFVDAFLFAAKSQRNPKSSRAASLLSEWDRRYTRENRRAVLFEEMMRQLSTRLWDELRTDSTRNPIPTDMMTAVLLRDSTSAWWDERTTPGIEHRDDLLRAVMATALDSVIAAHGEPNDDRWRWDHVRFANISHLLRLPAFSRTRIPVQGGSATIWPSTGDGRHGPSWRMVVEMSTPRRAWGTYPGGQSGNPLSARYDDRLKFWREGTLDTLRLPTTPEHLSATQQRARLVLTPPAGAR